MFKFNSFQNTSPGASIIGKHIMAYCLLNLGYGDKVRMLWVLHVRNLINRPLNIMKALEHFKTCVQEGLHDDWQLVVELEIEQEALKKIRTA